ncbi:MAG: type II toxin-antitoxin system VapC family toxin [Candidatus Marsarchaeota archaeon]|nr:type II toxin-antitoxin system VapC family toxin [Candidatus Marsarchaeota archaeon]MCL5111369.1 type II toxin-antitoxin system VapC family toxin [Candidatus Marsarchaeota archaeon]
MAIIDTNVVIEYLRGNAKIAKIVDSNFESGGISITTITRYELLQRANKDQSVLSFISEINVYGFDKRASDKAAEVWHRLKAKGKVVDDVDLFIASIALSNGEKLITLDNGFRHIEGDIEIVKG